jgi:hypothetical protein
MYEIRQCWDSTAAAAESIKQMAMGFAAAMQVFVFLQLLFELGLGYIDGGIHINGALFDDNGLMRQMQGDLAAAPIIALLFRFFEMDFHVSAVPIMPGNITVQSADLFFYMRPEPRINLGMYALDLKSLQHTLYYTRTTNRLL